MSRRTLAYLADCIVVMFAISFVVTVIAVKLDLHWAVGALASGALMATLLHRTHS